MKLLLPFPKSVHRSPNSSIRETLKRSFPRLAPVAGRMLSPFYSVAFYFQPHPDRRILEQVIFPALLDERDLRRIVFVGCAWYTRRYDDIFVDREFWTIDVDERARNHGADRHVVGSVTTLTRYFGLGSLDVIICNGVVGFGLDTREEADQAFSECYACLRPGGLLIIGWDDVERLRPYSLESLVSLHSFRPCTLPPFTSSRYPTFSRLQHTFDFYIRPEKEVHQGRTLASP